MQALPKMTYRGENKGEACRCAKYVTFDEMTSGGEIRSIILYLYNRIRVVNNNNNK
jgi:hypothetical protein